MHTYRLLATAGFAVTLVLSGCGGDHETHSAPTALAPQVAPAAAFNAADVALAQGMIPHHRQAVEMADLVTPDRNAGPGVTSLAARIKAAQQPEIDQMTGWLGEWGASVPAPAHMDHSATGDSTMPEMETGAGMMTAQEMAALAQASGPAFDRLWVDMMIRHHQGALVMAKEHLKSGKFGPTLELSKNIVATQTTEIDEMKSLLTKLG